MQMFLWVIKPWFLTLHSLPRFPARQTVPELLIQNKKRGNWSQGAEGEEPAGAELWWEHSVWKGAGIFRTILAPSVLCSLAATYWQMYKSYRSGRGDASSSQGFSRDKRALQTQGHRSCHLWLKIYWCENSPLLYPRTRRDAPTFPCKAAAPSPAWVYFSGLEVIYFILGGVLRAWPRFFSPAWHEGEASWFWSALVSSQRGQWVRAHPFRCHLSYSKSVTRK